AEASARIESNTIEVRHEDADSVTDEVTVENPWYRVTVNGQGDVTSIYDLRADRECVDQKAAFRWNQLTRASRQDRTQPEPVADPSAVSVTLRSGELSDEIVIRRDNHGVVESRIVLPKEAAQVEFHHVVDMAIIEADPEHRRTDWYT